eukprot:10393438-Karenia_brevis.AAC.1
MICKGYDFKDWIALIGQCPKWFLRKVHKLLLMPIAVLYMMPADTLRADDDVVHDLHICEQCGKSFDSFQKLKLHCFSVHAVLHPAHFYVSGVHCPCCL